MSGQCISIFRTPKHRQEMGEQGTGSGTGTRKIMEDPELKATGLQYTLC